MYDTVFKVLVNERHVSPEKIKPEATFADLGLDSLDVVDAAVSVEKATGCARISDENFKTMRTVSDLVEALSRDISRKEETC